MPSINLNSAIPTGENDPLPVNSVFYQVLIPSQLRGPNGELQYQMAGPFADLNSASTVAARSAGALLTATVILFRTPNAPQLTDAK